MDYPTLGASGLQVSRCCLGAMMFGHGVKAPTPEPESRRIIDAFLDAGHNFVDTANVYTGGESEEVVGRAIKSRRDQVVLATKVGFGPQEPNSMGLSRRHMTKALEDSLRRLDTEYVDLYQCHRPDPRTPIPETMAAMDDFVRSGKVRYIGCSNWSGSQIVEGQWAAKELGGTPFISLQPPYSLTRRRIEEDILPTCERQGLGTMIYSPLGGGVLTGKYRRGAPPPPDSRVGRSHGGGNWSRMLTEQALDLAEVVVKLADKLGTTPTAVALAWVLSRRHVTSVIIGPRTFGQYEENMAGFELSLDSEVLTRLNEGSAWAR